MKTLTLHPAELEFVDGDCVRKCTIERSGGEGRNEATELWFRFPDRIQPPDAGDCDSFLLSVVFDAMREKRDIVIEGDCTRTLLSNLCEFQLAWNKWCPDLYTPVEVRPKRCVEKRERAAGAVCAFSGGVDSTFSVYRHVNDQFGARTQRIQFCSLVYGFDIPLDQKEAYDSFRRRAELTLGDVQLQLVPVATNYKLISKASWDHSHAAALVAALGNFKKHAGACIVGSTEAYNSLVIPWGSSPITDHLLSGDDFEVIHDGASHTRTEKVNAIAGWEAGVRNLRVCWQGDRMDRNCGKCEKCVRTKLNFLATGNPVPPCFPESDIVSDIKQVQLERELAKAEWRQAYAYARSNGIEGDWLALIPGRIRGKGPLMRALTAPVYHYRSINRRLRRHFRKRREARLS